MNWATREGLAQVGNKFQRCWGVQRCKDAMGGLPKGSLLPTPLKNIWYIEIIQKRNVIHLHKTIFTQISRCVGKIWAESKRLKKILGWLERLLWEVIWPRIYFYPVFHFLTSELQYVILYLYSEAAVCRSSSRKVFLKILQHLQGNTCVTVSL